MKVNLRRSGVDVLGDLPWGTHFCQFYRTGEELLDILVPFFKRGLEDNELCVWVVSRSLSEEEVEDALRKAVPDLDAYRDRGQMEILSHDKWCLEGGAFDSHRVLNGWLEKLDHALTAGYDGLRATVDTFRVDDWHRRDFAAYEREVNNIIAKYPMIALCTYSLEKFGAADIIDVVKNHRFALAKREDNWESIEGFEPGRTEERIRRQNAVMEGINRILRKGLTCGTEEELARACLAVAEEVTRSRLGFMGEINAEGMLDDIVISDSGWAACAMKGKTDSGKLPMAFKIHGIYDRVLLEGKRFFVNDPASYPDTVGTPEGHPPLKSFMGVPLTHGGKTIGIVGLANREEGYRTEDLNTLEALAVAMVQAIMRKRAEEELRRSRDELERGVRERTAELREKDRLLLQQSRQAAMGEMIGNIAHQWRQPLNALGLIIQSLSMTHEMGKFSREYIEAIEHKAMGIIFHMSQTIDDFRNYFKPDKEKMPFNVNQAVSKTVSLIEDSFKSRQITIEVVAGDDPIINGYPNEYAQVLLNILLNARDAFTDPLSGNPRVTVTTGTENGKAVVYIADNAGGIPEDVLGKIFDPYFTTKSPDKGTGVGLFMSKGIIEKNMDGTLTVRNTEDGAEFRIEV